MGRINVIVFSHPSLGRKSFPQKPRPQRCLQAHLAILPHELRLILKNKHANRVHGPHERYQYIFEDRPLQMLGAIGISGDLATKLPLRTDSNLHPNENPATPLWRAEEVNWAN